MPTATARLRGIAFVATIATIATACHTTTAGTPTGRTLPSTTSPATAAARGEPTGGAPTVRDPIDNLDHWIDNPCDLLGEQQLAIVDLELVTSKAGHATGVGPRCGYITRPPGQAATAIGTELPGLADLYREQNEQHNFALFEPAGDIDGHPAVIADINDQREQGRCAIWVALNDTTVLYTVINAEPGTRAGNQPCEVATDLAALALHTIREGTHR